MRAGGRGGGRNVSGSRLPESLHKFIYYAGNESSRGTVAGCWCASQAKSSRKAKMQSSAEEGGALPQTGTSGRMEEQGSPLRARPSE